MTEPPVGDPESSPAVGNPDGSLAGSTRTRVGVVSLGCAKNLVDTEVMLGHLDRAGCEFVTDPADADVVVVNTCGFIDAARKESIDAILEAAEWKKSGRTRRVVVAGCMVQRYRDELSRELPEVDGFVDLDRLDQIVEASGITPAPPTSVLHGDLPMLAPRPTGARGASDTAVAAWGASSYLYDDRTPRRPATPGWTAYVKIAEGCDHTCSFCAIPSFRGTFRSRRPESVRREVERLVAGGVREVNLIAQDSSHYGRDLEIREGLAGLLENLSEVEQLRWLRVHYLYPNTITPHLIDTMARLAPVVDYVDLPLQHAHPDMLRRMRRGGSAERHLELLGRFRQAMGEVALRSTFIVGFPGETEEEFDALLDFVRQARFDHLGAFVYSHEQNTPAEDVADDVPDELKQERHERLLACQQEIALERLRGMVGRTVEVLVEGAHPETEHLLVGRMASQAPDVDGQILLNDGTAAAGTFASVEITEVAGYDLVGTILAPA